MAELGEDLTSSMPLAIRVATEVRLEHTKDKHCDDLDAKLKKTDDGERRIYCANCRHVLLRWGDSK